MGQSGSPSSLGPTFNEEEITTAWLQCSGALGEQGTNAELPIATKKKKKKRDPETKAKTKGSLDNDDGKNSTKNNVDLIVSRVLRKCDGVGDKSEKYFDMLNQSIGQVNQLGRIFTEEEVMEAYLRVTQFFAEQKEE